MRMEWDCTSPARQRDDGDGLGKQGPGCFFVDNAMWSATQVLNSFSGLDGRARLRIAARASASSETEKKMKRGSGGIKRIIQKGSKVGFGTKYAQPLTLQIACRGPLVCLVREQIIIIELLYLYKYLPVMLVIDTNTRIRKVFIPNLVFYALGFHFKKSALNSWNVKSDDNLGKQNVLPPNQQMLLVYHRSLKSTVMEPINPVLLVA